MEMSDEYKLGFNAGYAVMFFYAISGFLITYTLSRNYEGGVAGALSFYRKRAVRIFALYWPLVLLAFCLVPGAWGDFAAAGWLQKFSSVFLIGIDWQAAARIKGAAIVGLSQAWTLGAELTFYLAAPWLMRSWKVASALLVLSLGFRLVFVMMNGPALNDVWTYNFPVSTFCFFMLGHLACIASQRWPMLASPVLGLSLLAASAAAMLWGGSYADFDVARFWLAVAFFTVALPGIFAATMHSRWMNALGDLSYPVYLVHLLPLLIAGPVFVEIASRFSPSGYVSTAVFVGVVLACAIAAHRLLEIPTARAMRWVLAGRTRPAGSALHRIP